MTALDRPRLADVLARVTTCDDVEAWRSAQGYRTGVLPLIAAKGDGAILRPKPWQGTFHPWAHPSPADALGALVEAALLPEHWADAARAPRWWTVDRCRACGGSIATREECSGDERAVYADAAPPSHAALVAVASLPADTLARAEAVAAVTWPRARLVWRVMTAKALREHHERTTVSGRGLPVVVSLEETQMAGLRWPASCPRYAATRVPKDAARAWPALRALALTEDGEPTGLHLVALDDARVVLAVEAL